MPAGHTPHIRIRQAGPPDAALLEALARQIWEAHYTPLIGAAQVAYMLDKFQSQSAIRHDMVHGYTYDIAFADDTPCGYCAVRSDKTAHFLSKLYVKESCRGIGVARALVECAAARAKGAGAGRIWLTCNKHNTGSLAAYARLGFITKETCVTDIGGGYQMDDYVLEKTI